MRHIDSIKMMLAGGMLTLGAWTSSAQSTKPNNWNAEDSNWGINGNWRLESGSSFVPNNNFGTSFTPEYAVIDNGGTANIFSNISEVPLAVFLGNSEGSSGHLVMTSGELNVEGLSFSGEDVPSDNGRLVVGLLGTGSFDISGGTLTTSNGFIASGTGGGTGTIMMSGGIINSSGVGSIGAGGGEAAIWEMSGGVYNQVTGDLNIADDGGGIATMNMSGGSINVQVNDLDIGGSNNARAIVNMTNDAGVTVAGRTWIGINSLSYARMEMSDTSSLTSNEFNIVSGGDTVLVLRDQSSLNVTDVFKQTTGVIRVEGHEVDINTVNLDLRGRYNPTISSSGNSVIHVSGDTNIGGTVELSFDGVAPQLGDSWTLIQSSNPVTGTFSRIEGPRIGDGIRYSTVKDGNDVKIAAEKALTFSYNTASGRSTLKDYNGGITIKGYRLTSASGAINIAGWNSMVDGGLTGWDEANPTEFGLIELMVPGTNSELTFFEGQMHNLGRILSAIEDVTPFGQSINASDLKLEYFTDTGEVKDAIIDFGGTLNNLVLHVDKTTGRISLQNHSTKTVGLKGYSVTSGDGSLDLVGWDSLADQSIAGWDEANPTEDKISELIMPGADETFQLNPGDILDLGFGVDAGLSEMLALSYFIDGEVDGLSGVVVYDGIPVSIDGDWDLDGDVDLEDLEIVKNHFGDNADLASLLAVRNNFGASSAVSLAAIPEPSSVLLLLGALLEAIPKIASV